MRVPFLTIDDRISLLDVPCPWINRRTTLRLPPSRDLVRAASMSRSGLRTSRSPVTAERRGQTQSKGQRTEADVSTYKIVWCRREDRPLHFCLILSSELSSKSIHCGNRAPLRVALRKSNSNGNQRASLSDVSDPEVRFPHQNAYRTVNKLFQLEISLTISWPSQQSQIAGQVQRRSHFPHRFSPPKYHHGSQQISASRRNHRPAQPRGPRSIPSF